ncbi:MAG: response regulator transcription factor [Hydrogenovibrio sp.]|uniref:response regulator transcription factor n=1 Tax=Hydrogenovibrio sp. TaxID=2065821 RepID=UPI0028709BD2|nr:response regulator transcription factor [Hydrogenovibrio sp.]MDR9498763.1 response regulator transcription factor [Hydrogenovibrio sp.]
MPSKSMPPMELLSHLTVLFADDDAVLRETIGESLSLYFKDVVLAKDGEDALKKFEQASVHIVILDISMPKIDGLTVADRLRQQDENIPILILTSYKEESQLMAAIRLGLVDYLLKPIEFQNLRNSLIRCAEKIVRNGGVVTTLANQAQYHLLSNRVTHQQESHTLTRKERLFLDMLLRRRGQLVHLEDILNQLGNEDYTEASLRNLVYRLRKKVGHDAIKSIKELGYLTP